MTPSPHPAANFTPSPKSVISTEAQRSGETCGSPTTKIANSPASTPRPTSATPDDPALDEGTLWAAVQTRSRAHDGQFVYGVRTTGIFCRPSCPARRPLRANTLFFATPALAQARGLRPCLRCHPLSSAPEDPAAALVRTVSRLLQEAHEAPPPLAELAAKTGRSPFHLQRTFRRLTGLSPKQYHQALRRDALRQALRPRPPATSTTRPTITDAALAAGFTSTSQLYADASLGMRPTDLRNGARGLEITWVALPSPLGRMLLAATDRGLCFLHFGEHDVPLLARLRTEYPHATLVAKARPYPPDLTAWIDALDLHLAGATAAPSLPVHVRATAFQARVWNFLRSIPAGETRTYTAVAQAIGQPSATRAVANACARNTVALAIPCHRVLRADGALGGFRWGLPRKQALLTHERQQASQRPQPPNAQG